MDIKAITKYARLSPTKGRDLAREIQGLPVHDALRVLEFSSRKAAGLLSKTLKSALGNAQNNANLPVDSLRVKEAVIDRGPQLRRFRPRARGGASPIHKPTCHIKVVLTDGQPDVENEA